MLLKFIVYNVQVKIKTNLKYCVSIHLISFLIINRLKFYSDKLKFKLQIKIVVILVTRISCKNVIRTTKTKRYFCSGYVYIVNV